MKLFLPPIHQRENFNREDPFSHDSFNRRQLAENLTNLIRAASDGCVISIDAAWGDGKTTFIQLWRHQLELDEKFIPVYYDAFAHDFSSNPFISISATIHECLKNAGISSTSKEENKEQVRNLAKAGKKLAINLLAAGASHGASALTAGLVSADTIAKTFGDAAKNVTEEVFSATSLDPYSLYSDQENLIGKYKDLMKEILSQDGNNRKVIVFIDELDRCRPDFSVEVIEKLKHLFEIQNVFFIISFNRKQMLKTIKSVYGVDEDDAEVYFQKFIHVETRLPSIDYNEIDKDRVHQHLLGLLTALQADTLMSRPDLQSKEVSEFICTYLPLNPRQLERAATLMTFSLGALPENPEWLDVTITMILCAIKIGRSDYYNAIKDGELYLDRPDNGNKSYLEKV